jgi:tRNA dimethylallyltransferase
MSANKYLIVLAGPTASGKTEVSIKIVQHFKTEIISADSRQFYSEMSIGTAKPSEEDLTKVPHHFINSLSVHDHFTVGDFEKEAQNLLSQLFKKHSVVVMTGGSGLFIKAVCEGLDIFPEVPDSISKEVNNLFKNEGIEALQKELKTTDPEYFDKVDQNNPMRLIRAIQVCRASGQSFSNFLKGKKADRFYKIIYLNLELDREILYDRINRRADQMIESGLEKEARILFPFKHLIPLQTVGYQEFFDYFDNKITLQKAIELIKRNSRRYAKRQMTWLRKDNHWKSFHPSQVQEIIDFLKEKTGLQ